MELKEIVVIFFRTNFSFFLSKYFILFSSNVLSGVLSLIEKVHLISMTESSPTSPSGDAAKYGRVGSINNPVE